MAMSGCAPQIFSSDVTQHRKDATVVHYYTHQENTAGVRDVNIVQRAPGARGALRKFAAEDRIGPAASGVAEMSGLDYRMPIRAIIRICRSAVHLADAVCQRQNRVVAQ
jgi:hypothetical protein